MGAATHDRRVSTGPPQSPCESQDRSRRFVQLDFLTAQALNRARRKIIVQFELARDAGLAQGTVSNFLRGRPTRVGHAESILNVLSATLDKKSLPEDQAVYVRDTILRARSALTGDLPPTRHVGKTKGTSWEPSDYFGVLMALTDEPRLNLTKAFDYLNEKHFNAHVGCVTNGVEYQ